MDENKKRNPNVTPDNKKEEAVDRELQPKELEKVVGGWSRPYIPKR